MRILVAIYSDSPAWTLPSAQVDGLRQRLTGHDVRHAEDEDGMVRLISDADIAFTSRLTPDAFAAARRLRWVHSPAAGVGSMLFAEMRTSPILLTNSRGMNAGAVAEHALALMFAIARRLPEAVRAQDGRRWIQTALSALPVLRGRTLGIVGLGSIGSELARMAAGLGMRVIGTRREADAPVPEGVAEALTPSDLPRLLAVSDIVVLAAPLTRDTRGLIGRAELAAMKPTAWLVNVARGKLVREADLIAALAEGVIAGAALDVVEHEPLDPASPLWTVPNVLITPHVAGFREDYWDAAVALFEDNLRRFLRGDALLNQVDKQAGY